MLHGRRSRQGLRRSRSPITAERPRKSRGRRGLSFLGDVVRKADQDQIFFLAGAISFNTLVALVPFFLFIVGISGIILSTRFVDPAGELTELLSQWLPMVGGDVELQQNLRGQINTILEDRAGFTLLGGGLLVWFSTRLVGTLRTVLARVFNVSEMRGLIRGKVYDVQVVVVGGLLFMLNLGITAGLIAVRDIGIQRSGLEDAVVGGWLRAGVAQGLAFVTIWLLFLGLYRYLPARPIPWRVARIAATFTAVLHEFLKVGFGWYVTESANYQTTYGNLLSLAVLFFWIHYMAIGFSHGGEVAQVWELRWERENSDPDALA